MHVKTTFMEFYFSWTVAKYSLQSNRSGLSVLGAILKLSLSILHISTLFSLLMFIHALHYLHLSDYKFGMLNVTSLWFLLIYTHMYVYMYMTVPINNIIKNCMNWYIGEKSDYPLESIRIEKANYLNLLQSDWVENN